MVNNMWITRRCLSTLLPARLVSMLMISALSLFLFSCSQINRPTTEPFFARSIPPSIQEFRWSDGKTPKSFDPARAAAAPETNIVRSLYEGLTDIDAKTLKEVPAAAERWEASTD